MKGQKKWYPKVGTAKHPVDQCPRCIGSGIVEDLHSRKERPCACCSGTGKLSKHV